MTPRPALIDADVHQGLNDSFWQRLELPWRNMAQPSGYSWPAHALGHNGLRTDVHIPGGPARDADPACVIEDLLDRYSITYAILNGSKVQGVQTHPNASYALAFVQAYNDWLSDEWLAADPRFRGSILVAPQDIPGSVSEIERWGDHPGMVQVLLPGTSPQLYGKRPFWPLYEAAAHHRLPVAIHPLGLGPTASGWMSTYLEHHTMLTTRDFLDHLVSLICEGVFVEFPDLKVVLIEGGVSIYLPLLWRLDKNWRAVRAEVPWLDRPPSAFVASNIRFTTQPIEEPDDQRLLLELYRRLHADTTLMFSTDFPHWDFDAPDATFRGFPEDLRRRIFADNARELYRLDLPNDRAEGVPR